MFGENHSSIDGETSVLLMVVTKDDKGDTHHITPLLLPKHVHVE